MAAPDHPAWHLGAAVGGHRLPGGRPGVAGDAPDHGDALAWGAGAHDRGVLLIVEGGNRAGPVGATAGALRSFVVRARAYQDTGERGVDGGAPFADASSTRGVADWVEARWSRRWVDPCTNNAKLDVA